MSYILEAIRKDEREREGNQFIDYPDNTSTFPIKKLWISIIIILNVIIWSVFLWPKESLKSPQITIISPLSSPVHSQEYNKSKEPIVK